MKPCSTCLYYQADKPVSDDAPAVQGVCRRYPPGMFIVEEGKRFMTQYTIVKPEFACGEHRPSVRVAARKAA